MPGSWHAKVRAWVVYATGVGIILFAGLPACHGVTSKEKAWAMFEAAAKSNHTTLRAIGIRALGLLPGEPRARVLAEAAMEDPKPEVRIAAVTALGQMRSMQSIPKIEKLLKDEKLSVVVATAHVLHDLKDDASADAVYYSILTGERKPEGLIAKQVDTLENPHELMKIGEQVGIGFIPYAGIGWDAWRFTHASDPNPVRAVAATILAKKPGPEVAKALVAATKDKNWIVRAAATEAIARRGDPSLGNDIQYGFFDPNAHVRYTTAAAVIRLSDIDEKNLRAKKAQEKIANQGQEQDKAAILSAVK
jgi:HEAT repeat protein